MSDKTAVITGATKGLGKALSIVFAEHGYDIIGIYHADQAAAESLRREFQKKNLSGVFIQQDITQEGEWTEFDEVLKNKQSSKFTLIANASAAFQPKPLHFIEWQETSNLIEVNIKGTFLLFKKLIPYMVKAHEGLIVGVLSAAMDKSAMPKGFGAYVTAKCGLQGLIKAIAAEYCGRGVRVFTVSPEFMETSLTSGWSEHLKSLIRPPAGGSDPMKVAAKIFQLADDAKITARGENYNLGDALFGMVGTL